MIRISVWRSIACAAFLLGGCAGGGAERTTAQSFDLGLEPPQARLPLLVIGTVHAVPPHDSLAMHYRLAYRNPAELAAYANSEWSAPPAVLLRKQLVRASASGSARCTLNVELQEFSQSFSAPAQSTARIDLLASVSAPGSARAQRTVSITEPSAGADAISGVAAHRRAVDRAIAELATWAGSLSVCR